MERDRPAGEGGAGAGGFAERLMLEGLWGTAGPSADLYTSTQTHYRQTGNTHFTNSSSTSCLAVSLTQWFNNAGCSYLHCVQKKHPLAFYFISR